MSINFDDRRFLDAVWREDFKPSDWHDGQSDGHTAVIVAVGDQAAPIDEGIAELVYWMWRNGIFTDGSCQGVEDFLEEKKYDESWVYIQLLTMEDAELFLSLATPEDGVPGGIWDRATGSNYGKASTPWEWMLSTNVRGRVVSLSTAVFFPSSDVPLLVARLAKEAS